MACGYALFLYPKLRKEVTRVTDKQRIENLKHQVEYLDNENKKLRKINMKQLSEDLESARKEYSELINALIEQRQEYEKLNHELRLQKQKYTQEMNELLERLV